MSTETLTTVDAITKAVLASYLSGFAETVGETEFDNWHAYAVVSKTVLLNLGADASSTDFHASELAEIREALPEGDIAAIVATNSQGFDSLVASGDEITIGRQWDALQTKVNAFYEEEEDSENY